MKGVVIILVCMVIVAAFFSGCTIRPDDPLLTLHPSVEEVNMMRLTSVVYKEGETIPRKYTCQGENINPPIRWDEAPIGTKSFALVFDDPDAPMGTWYHWIIKDISPEIKEIHENSKVGVEVTNSFGNSRYGGPCPPSGIHRYIFHFYALNVSTIVAKNIQELQREVDLHKIGEATLMGRYKKV